MNGPYVPWRKVWLHWEIYWFVVPTVVLIALFMYYPAASGIFHSFFRWNGADISEFNGMDNYVDLFGTIEFWNSFRVAFIIGAANVVKMIPAIVVAVCIHRCSSARVQHLYRFLFVIPMIIPPLVGVLIWRTLFFEATTGYFNLFLDATGLHDVLVWLDGALGWGGVFHADRNPAWLGDPNLILAAVILWGFPWVGSFAILTHLAKLGNIDASIYEAAGIDGAGWFSRFRHIELPLLSGSIYVNLVLVIIGTIKDAGTILLLAGWEGGPGGVVMVPALFMLRRAFLDGRMGYACAIGVILMVVVMGLQKLANIWLEWDDLSPRGRRGYRWVFLLLAAMLIAFGRFNPGAQSFHPLAMTLCIAAIPRRATLAIVCAASLALYWDSGIWRIVMLGGVLAGIPYRGLLRALPSGVVEAAGRWRERPRIVDRATIPVTPSLWERATTNFARMAKHGTIWMVLLVSMLPVYLMIVVSFKDNTQFYTKPTKITHPLHLENWTDAWNAVGVSTSNTVYASIAATALALFFALCSGYFFARLRMPLSGVLWNALLVLMMYPAIASMVPLFQLLSSMYLLNTLTAIIIVWIANGQIFSIFVLRTFIADIPRDLFEAAEIDGASHFRQMWSVVRPLSGPILATVGILAFTGYWNDFILPLIVLRDSEKLTIMVQLMRLSGEYIKYWGPMMAGYALASVPVVILFAFSMRLFMRGVTEGAIKT